MSRIQQALLRVSQSAQDLAEPDEIVEAPARVERVEYAERTLVVPAPASASAFDAASAPGDAEPPVAAAALPLESNPKVIVSPAMAPEVIEEYRKLAAQLHRSAGDRKTTVVMVVSAMAGEGKTLTASNLSLTLSHSFRQRVLLIDADLRRPSVHEVFRIPNDRGLNDGLTSATESKLAVVDVSPTLTVLPAGRPNPDPMSVLTSDRMRDIIDSASTSFDWVVVDTPPIGILPDANLLAKMADVVLLVVAAGKTSFKVVQRAVKSMDRARIAGVVLNRVADVPQPDHKYYMTATATR